jgi:hypothetical protein
VAEHVRMDREGPLRRLQREQSPGPHVFVFERGSPMAPKWNLRCLASQN